MQAFKRDGETCLQTAEPFRPFDPLGVPPILSHVIPNSIYDKVCVW